MPTRLVAEVKAQAGKFMGYVGRVASVDLVRVEVVESGGSKRKGWTVVAHLTVLSRVPAGT